VRYKLSKRVIVPGFDTGELTSAGTHPADAKTISLK